jgi:HNH endonuclease
LADKREYYYRARGFSVYYFANAIHNVVRDSGSYIRGIEDILGDQQVLNLMRSFHRFTNLHHFSEAIIREVVEEEADHLDEKPGNFLRQFLKTYDVPFVSNDLLDQARFYDFVSNSDRYHDAIEELTDEVFHVFFNDLQFLQQFNLLCASYIENAGFGNESQTERGTLKRVRIPIWTRRAIFHECRNCKRSVAATVNAVETERYDHIVPLAAFGSNDVTNIQLLCAACNLKKAAKIEPVSPLYPKAILPQK